MKRPVVTLFGFLVTAALLVAALPGGTGSTAAQGAEPPRAAGSPAGVRSRPGGGPYRAPDGTWFVAGGEAAPHGADDPAAPRSTGGPDDFGYTWSDSVALNWIDATSGTNTGLSGSSWGHAVGPIPLAFPFKYYENSYTAVYVAASGYVGFTAAGDWEWQSDIPSPALPNNVVAPYWTPLQLANSGAANRVYYKKGGTFPNRYFVAEWYQVSFYGAPYTFEVVLHENGDIVLQYLAMGEVYACGSAGIEDSTGLDGLTYLESCADPPSNKAVRFYRPAPSARVSIHPLYQGRFARAAETAAFQVPIRNTGELGADTYGITFTSTWAAALYAADGTTPLSDTDGDGTADTGPVPPGSSATVVARATAPAIANVGDSNVISATVRSSLNASQSRTAGLQSAVPAPFAQVYRDDADGAMSLYLAQPSSAIVKKATPDGYNALDPSVAETASGFAYFWSRGRSLGTVYVEEIEYTLLDRAGNTVRGVGKLASHSGATMSTYDAPPAIAVAPNGRMGVLWLRQLMNTSTWLSNYNVYFAVLDGSGTLIYGPANLTNNGAWGDWESYNVPEFYSPRVAATGDNRFVLAWQRDVQQAPGGGCADWCYLDDIYYAVRDTSGGAIKAVTRFTNDQAGGDGYYDPTVTGLSGNRALLAYDAPGSVTYGVLNSSGNTVNAAAATGADGWAPDAVQLAGGSIVLAWTRWEERSQIEFAVLDGSTYGLGAGPTALDNPAAATGDAYVSVAADASGHAILTWMDGDWDRRRNLYYALVDGDGSVLTDPMIFRTSDATPPRLQTSGEGYGNSSYGAVTPAAGVDLGLAAPPVVGAPPGGLAAAALWVTNRGGDSATSVVLTATLDAQLAYDDAAPAPSSVAPPTVVWNLPDLDFLGGGQVVLHVAVPSAALGTRYPITWLVSSAGSEANPADNTAATEVMISRQILLPAIFKG